MSLSCPARRLSDASQRHSIVPTEAEEWPTLEDILAFRLRVRARLLQLYDDLECGRRTIYRRLARVLVMTFEHEGFHVEVSHLPPYHVLLCHIIFQTLLYMLIQRAGTGTIPPPGFPQPLFASLVKQWVAHSPPLTPTVTLGPADIVLGFDDPESGDILPDRALAVSGRGYGWDNESPARHERVRVFRAEWRPVTNGEYAEWWRAQPAGARPAPQSWAIDADGEVLGVRTAFGPVSFDVAREWPVLVAYDDLAAYARAKGGRLPTEAELRLFLDTFDEGYEGAGNVGFRTWHPAPCVLPLAGVGHGVHGLICGFGM
jgi:formylglycine-generating enzyme required for sulfatase activity